jgi:hypothetical protein
LWSKIKKLKFTLSFASPEKEFFFIFMMWLHGKNKKKALLIMLDLISLAGSFGLYSLSASVNHCSPNIPTKPDAAAELALRRLSDWLLFLQEQIKVIIITASDPLTVTVHNHLPQNTMR